MLPAPVRVAAIRAELHREAARLEAALRAVLAERVKVAAPLGVERRVDPQGKALRGAWRARQGALVPTPAAHPVEWAAVRVAAVRVAAVRVAAGCPVPRG